MRSEAYNMDCMEYMRTLPDNAFDLAIVDPPYGDGLHAENGGGKGWFTKYNQSISQIDVESACEPKYNRFGNPGTIFEKYKRDPESTSVSRTGGTWAEKYGKKIIAWDTAPRKEYFDELFRVSRNQIIWGGQLLSTTADKVFSDLAQADNF